MERISGAKLSRVTGCVGPSVLATWGTGGFDPAAVGETRGFAFAEGGTGIRLFLLTTGAMVGVGEERVACDTRVNKGKCTRPHPTNNAGTNPTFYWNPF